MKILIVDYVLWAGALLAQRLSKDGHEVVYSGIWGPKSDSPYMDALCKGLPGVTVAPDGWMNWMKWADVATITGSEHKGQITATLREHGVPVCGPGRWAVQLELDRSFGHQIFKEIGFNPTVSHKFTDPKLAISYVEKYPDKYVVKLDQTARAVSETYVGQDPTGKDVLDQLQMLSATLRFADGSVGIYLDEMVEGTECGIGGWFNGKELIGDLMVNYEDSGGYAYDFTVKADRFIDVDRLQAVLAKYKYRGSFDINGFITPEKEYRPIEWTPRWAGGTTEFFCHATEDLGELLYACATGGKAQVIKERFKNRVGVVVNARDESDEVKPRDVVLPDGEDLPYVIDEDSSFYVMWPTKTRRGWMSLPIHDSHERRLGMYISVGDNLEAAFDKAEAAAKKAKIVETTIEAGRAKDGLEDRFEEGRRFAIGEGWIHKAAKDFCTSF